MFVDGLGQPCQPGDKLIVAQTDHEAPATVLINRAPARDHQPHASGGSFDVEVNQRIGNEPLWGVEQMDGRHDDAVSKPQGPDVDGCEEFSYLRSAYF